MIKMKLKNSDSNLLGLIRDAHFWEYADINDNVKKSKAKKPKMFFTKSQLLLIIIAILCTSFTNGISADAAGYVISAMSLFTAMLIALVVSLFDKFGNTNFDKYKEVNNSDLYPFGIRLKNYFKKTIILTLYTAVLSILCILLLTFLVLYKPMVLEIDLYAFISNINEYDNLFIVKAILLFLYRIILFYFLLNFIYITMQLITSFYDYMVSEIQNVKLK